MPGLDGPVHKRARVDNSLTQTCVNSTNALKTNKLCGVMERGLHPYGVQPLGNALTYEGHDHRSNGLGDLAVFGDEILLSIFYCLDAKDISRLASSSAMIYTLCHFNGIVQNIVSS